jgi:cytochrome P450
MPYLTACLRESLRFDPPIVSFLPRWSEGVELCGRFIPAGVEIACSPYVISRNKEIFGEDVHVFRPERYADADPAWVAIAARYDFTFGYGPRGCIGQGLSQLITVKAIVHVSAMYIIFNPFFYLRVFCFVLMFRSALVSL